MVPNFSMLQHSWIYSLLEFTTKKKKKSASSLLVQVKLTKTKQKNFLMALAVWCNLLWLCADLERQLYKGLRESERVCACVCLCVVIQANEKEKSNRRKVIQLVHLMCCGLVFFFICQPHFVSPVLLLCCQHKCAKHNYTNTPTPTHKQTHTHF